jgi:hypothetical protein
VITEGSTRVSRFSISRMDPELERLVADMSVVAQMTKPRRNGGGAGLERGNKPGMLDDGSSATGQVFTVCSNGEANGRRVPSVVNLTDGQAEVLGNQASNGKRVKIFVVPEWNDGFITYCFQFIGQGASFCTAKNCTMAHHHASKKQVAPGKLYVAKSAMTAFVTPSITSSVIDSEVLIDWRARSLSLHEWNEKFCIATSASDEAPASSAAMEVQENVFRTKALTFTTPAKRKRAQDYGESESPSLLDVSAYSPFFKEDEVAPVTDIGHVAGILARLDQCITTDNAAVINLIGDYKHEHLKAGDMLHSMWLRIEALTASLGTMPARLAFEYLAPSAWASIGAIAAKLDGFGAKVVDQGKILYTYKEEVKTLVNHQVKLGREDFYKRLQDFKEAFIQATRGLGGRLNNVDVRLIGLCNNPVPQSTYQVTRGSAANPLMVGLETNLPKRQ